MKNRLWLVLGMALSTSLLAQPLPNAPSPAPIETPAPAPAVTNTAPPPAPEIAPPASPAPKKSGKSDRAGAKKSAKKKAAPMKRPAVADLRTVPLVPGPAVVDANNVNVRGQPTLKSEVVSRVTKGQAVTVLEEIVDNDSAPDEPSAWAKISLPAEVSVWVFGEFIDPANKTVIVNRLNLRSGPGENYSVLGRIERGETVKPINTKGDWIEIEAPANAYAFIAAQFLKQEPPAPIVSATPETVPAVPEPPPATPSEVTEAPPLAAAPTEAPATAAPVTPPPAESPADTNAPTATADATAPPPPAPIVVEPPPKRVVQREGIVRSTFSIQAPTPFELVSPETKRTIDYLYTTSTNLDLRRYKGLRIIVTGEEGLEERWGNTPVLTIQKIHLAD